MMNYSKNIMKLLKGCQKKFASESVYSEKYLKAKIKFIIEKPNQISTIIKYQKKVLNVFVYQ